MPELKATLEQTCPGDKERFNLNAELLEIYKTYDVKKVGYLNLIEFQKLVHFLMQALGLSVDDKALPMIAQFLDQNGDGKFTEDEIVHKYTREERKAWFAKKRDISQKNDRSD